MPLTPQYTWVETATTVSITINAPGLTKAKSDLLICDTFLRVNCPPYLLQIDLVHQVDDTNGTAVFGPDGLTCCLNKVQEGQWGHLVAQGSKQELQERRQEAQQRLQLRLESHKQAQLDQRKALDKATSDKRIELDRQKRNTIEEHKQHEMETQKAQVASWQDTVGVQEQAESDYEDEDIDEPPSSSGQDQFEYHGRGWRPKKARALEDHADSAPQQLVETQAIWDSPSDNDGMHHGAESEESSATAHPALSDISRAGAESDADTAEIPPVRSGCLPVTVEFTKLETEHLPARETREQEISSYKRKAQDTKLSDDSMGMSERQPMFLKDKADAMHKAANCRAAVNAYSQAIQIDASLTACYSNRAASYLKLKEFRLCAEDCTTALAQLAAATSSSAANSSTSAKVMHSSVVKLFTRRAAAHVELHDLQSAKADFAQALARSPDNKQLQADLKEVEACLQPADSRTLRAIADERFKSQDLQGAADAYTAVLALSDAANADKLAAASNRAACSLAQHSYTNAVNDCSLALGLLIGRHVPDVHAWLGPNHQGAIGFSDKQKQSLGRLLARRGVALGQLARCTAAVADLQAAQHIYVAMGQLDKAEALKADIRKIDGLTTSTLGQIAENKS